MDTTASVPLRKSVVYLFPQAILKHDVLGVSPAKQRCAGHSPVVLIALAAERVHARVKCPAST
jgi:hypothetical protein